MNNDEKRQALRSIPDWVYEIDATCQEIERARLQEICPKGGIDDLVKKRLENEANDARQWSSIFKSTPINNMHK